MIHTDYEKFVASVVSDFRASPDVKVFHQREFVGRRSGRRIVVDVSVDRDFGGFRDLWIVECKHYARKVEVGDIEEFQTKIDDIGAQKGLVFSTVGFQLGAIKSAKAYGIGLARLSDRPEPGDILILVNGPALPMPLQRTDGTILSGAINLAPWVADGWQWFWSGPKLVDLLIILDLAFPIGKGKTE